MQNNNNVKLCLFYSGSNDQHTDYQIIVEAANVTISLHETHAFFHVIYDIHIGLFVFHIISFGSQYCYN